MSILLLGMGDVFITDHILHTLDILRQPLVGLCCVAASALFDLSNHIHDRDLPVLSLSDLGQIHGYRQTHAFLWADLKRNVIGTQKKLEATTYNLVQLE